MDPLWSILTAEGKRYGKWGIEDFFRSGEEDINALLSRATALGYARRKEAALDFGCGVGRLTRALGQHFVECWGVDIAESMINHAMELNRDLKNLHFQVNDREDLSVFYDCAFDFIVSLITLQHVPRRRAIEAYITDFVRIVREGGIVVFQLPTYVPLIWLQNIRSKAYYLLRKVGLKPSVLYETLRLVPMENTYIRKEEVLRIVNSSGGTVVHLEERQTSGTFPWQIGTYYVTKKN
jgi:SAM-dependent methyltransferase